VTEQLAMLLAERHIGRQLAQLARAMDERDWPALDAIVAADAVADFGTGPVAGRAAMVAVMRAFLDACGPTQHLLANLTVEVDGDAAVSRCYVSDLHLGAGSRAHLSFQTLGEYRDRWQHAGGRWWLVQRIKVNRAHLGAFEVLGPGPPGWSRA
jgi:hypothetical protein